MNVAIAFNIFYILSNKPSLTKEETILYNQACRVFNLLLANAEENLRNHEKID